MIVISPNPATGEVRIHLQLQESATASIRISNVAGAVMESRELGHLAAGLNEIPLEVKSWPSGVYFFELRWAGNGRAGRFSVSK
jgi:hypothetical protein